jgi:hypothetical protein
MKKPVFIRDGLFILAGTTRLELATSGVTVEPDASKLLKSLETEKPKLRKFCHDPQPIRNHLPGFAK